MMLATVEVEKNSKSVMASPIINLINCGQYLEL